MSRPRITSTAVLAERPAAGGIERITEIGPGRYLREVLTDDERRVTAEPLSRREAEAAAGHPLTPAPIQESRLTVERALLRLLWERLGEPVGHREVSCLMGRETSRQAVRKAARRLSRALPIESVKGPKGGYRLPAPGRRAES